ncbi:MAG TPA: glycosyltransferase family 39 protein, partial [Saprospiraceae bacterium]|nr:glycosyltransferase family 39 protein [Saprospiraceae bacterium]
MSKLRKPSPQKSPAARIPSPPPAISAPAFPAFLRNVRLQALLIFGFATLIYLNTLTHGFVLDDGIVITDNMFTQQGAKGIPGILTKDTFFGFFKVEGKETLVSGGRYHPLTLVLFALIYQVAGASPFVFHLFTVLLFAATCAVFYLTVRKIFARMGQDYADLLAWIAALIFAAHPIHTEVVANIKGCDEILTLLGCLGATYFAVRALHESKAVWAVLSGALFFLACLSKENAAAFVLVIPAALWCSLPQRSDNDSRPTQGWGDVLGATWPVWAAFAAFFVLRGTILHWRFGGEPMELMNNPFLKIENGAWVKFSLGEKMATIFYTLWKYVALLFAPLTLSHDYYPRQVPTMSFSDPAVLGSVALYGFLAYYALAGIWRHRDPVRFGILLYLLSLSIVSNVVFPIGTNMGERFAFMPSAGFCIAVAALLMRWAQQGKYSTVLAVVGVVAALFAARTLMRNPVWASNDRLFLSDATHSPNSAKLQNACAGTYFDRASKETDAAKKQEEYQLAVKHAKLAVNIHPTYKDALLTL